MGSCISKCSNPRRKKKKLEEVGDSSHVQDKLVIALDRVEIPKIPPEKPLASTPSSSFSYSKCTIPSSSSSSCSSASSFSISSLSVKDTTFTNEFLKSSVSSLSVKDRTFTNEFLQSCVKENPRIIRLNPTINKMSTVVPNLSTLPVNHSFQQTTLKKRARSRSPSTLARQKSFRRDQNTVHNSIPNRNGIRSPSPSRRFNVDNARSVPMYESPMRRFNADNTRSAKVYESPRKGRVANGGCNNVMKREIFRSPVREQNTKKMSPRVDLEFSERVGRKVDEKGVQEMDVVMENIVNPHIALDCFIFL